MPYGQYFSHVTEAIRKSVKPESLSDPLMSNSIGCEDACRPSVHQDKRQKDTKWQYLFGQCMFTMYRLVNLSRAPWDLVPSEANLYQPIRRTLSNVASRSFSMWFTILNLERVHSYKTFYIYLLHSCPFLISIWWHHIDKCINFSCYCVFTQLL